MKCTVGLNDVEVKKSIEKYGKNEITKKKARTFSDVYWGNYKDPIITILLVALIINTILTFFGYVEWFECFGILVSVIVSTFVSSISEYSNENVFERLQKEAEDKTCKVYRNDSLTEIRVSEIVVGDCVLLQTGDIIPADGRIIHGKISVDQSPLNGESKEIEKSKTDKEKKKYKDLWDSYSVFRSCSVCSGEAVFVVDVIGDETVYGKLTVDAQEDNRESPLTYKLSKLAKSISKLGIISAVLIIIFSFLNNAIFKNGFDMRLISEYFSDNMQVFADIIDSLIVGIIIIVVAVPEGLPLMIAIVCSLNMKKMLKDNVLVRKLIGIETAGSMNILFTDKTGTITLGKPSVISMIDGEENKYKSIKNMSNILRDKIITSVISTSGAKFYNGKLVGGNSTDKALMKFIGKSTSSDFEINKSVPFNSDKKFSMCSGKNLRGEEFVYVKGAAELILDRCKSCFVDGTEKEFNIKRIKNITDEHARRSSRVVAIAYKRGYAENEDIPDNLVFVCLAVIKDEIRKEARSAISDVRDAGIQVVMVTGDKKETAVAIAKEVGLLQNENQAITSDDLKNMSDDEVRDALPKIRVVARAVPTDKSRLVKIAKRKNLVIGMTGDGVNDVSALKAADVGFAMGDGSDAAAAASDIVILDNNFTSVRNAVLYGRTIYKSIKKFIKFQLTINIAAVIVSMLGPIIGIEKPLDIPQMLWINLIIDSLAAIAFGGEPPLKRYLKEKPINRGESIIDKEILSTIVIDGIYICSLSVIFFISPFIRNIFNADFNNIFLYTGFFTFFVFISVFNAFNARSDGLDAFDNIFKNKKFVIVMLLILIVQATMTHFGGRILRTCGLNIGEWLFVLGLSLTIFPIEFLRKIIVSLFLNKKRDFVKNS